MENERRALPVSSPYTMDFFHRSAGALVTVTVAVPLLKLS